MVAIELKADKFKPDHLGQYHKNYDDGFLVWLALVCLHDLKHCSFGSH